MGREQRPRTAFPQRSGAGTTSEASPVWRLAHKAANAKPINEYIPIGPQRSTLAATLNGEVHNGFTEFDFAQGPKFVGKNFTTGPKSPFDRGFTRHKHVEEGPEVCFSSCAMHLQNAG